MAGRGRRRSLRAPPRSAHRNLYGAPGRGGIRGLLGGNPAIETPGTPRALHPRDKKLSVLITSRIATIIQATARLSTNPTSRVRLWAGKSETKRALGTLAASLGPR